MFCALFKNDGKKYIPKITQQKLPDSKSFCKINIVYIKLNLSPYRDCKDSFLL